MKSFIAATLMLASLGFAAPPVSPPPGIYLPPPPDAARAANRLPREAAEALKNGEKFILFSLEPLVSREEVEKLKPDEKHHGYKVLGSTDLVKAETRTIAITSITDAVRNYNGMVGLCFIPRHSLRVIIPNGTIYDFVTCFQCCQIEIFSGENRIGKVRIKGTQKTLDDILTAAKVPLAKLLEGEK